MHIQSDSRNPNSIISYNESQLVINDVIYSNSLIVSKNIIISPWPIQLITELNETTIMPILHEHPEVILIGHSDLTLKLPMSIQSYLSKQHIGIESMSIGAASRTFNILLSEGRNCVAGFIF